MRNTAICGATETILFHEKIVKKFVNPILKTLENNGCKIIENIDPELISKIYKPPYELDSSLLENFSELIPNEYLVNKSVGKLIFIFPSAFTISIGLPL